MAIRTVITARPIDIAVELERLGPAGAVASFIGHVRADDGVATLTLEHHPLMTERALVDLARDAVARWALSAVSLVHRVGPMVTGDAIVIVATASAHRADALAACAFLIDRLKTDVPLWKCETLTDGTRRWVEPRDGDAARAEGWEQRVGD